jgi:hypothetical protein
MFFVDAQVDALAAAVREAGLALGWNAIDAKTTDRNRSITRAAMLGVGLQVDTGSATIRTFDARGRASLAHLSAAHRPIALSAMDGVGVEIDLA